VAAIKAVKAVIPFPFPAAHVDIPTAIEKIGRYLTARDLSGYLAISYEHILRMAKAGKIPCARIGGSVRFDPVSIATWLRQRAA
jgi:excisionase family DNA binding protein